MGDSWGAHRGGVGFHGIPPPHPQRSPSTVSDPGSSTGPPIDIKPAIQAAALAGYSGIREFKFYFDQQNISLNDNFAIVLHSKHNNSHLDYKKLNQNQKSI